MGKSTFEEKFASWIEELKRSGDYYHESLKIDIAESICKIMQSEKITKIELAQRAKISPRHLNFILKGERNASLPTLIKIASALGCTVEIKFTRETK